MIKLQKLLPLFLITLMLAISSCETSEDDESDNGASSTVPDDVAHVATSVISSISLVTEGSGDLPTCMTATTSSDETTITIDYNSCQDSEIDATINGTITLSRSVSGSTMTVLLTGTVNITGYTVSTVVFDLTLIMPYDTETQEPSGEPTSVSGTITADGTEYDVSSFDFSGDSDSGDGEDDGDSSNVSDPNFLVSGVKLEEPSDSGIYYSLIIYSDDGSAWGYPNISKMSDPISDLWDVQCDTTGMCVAVGDNGAAFYSNDGINWTAGNTGVDIQLTGVAFGDNRWLAVGTDSETTKGTILYSDNHGITWTISNVSNTEYNIKDVAYGDGTGDINWVAISRTSNSWKSTDGANWTPLDLDTVMTGESAMQSICFGNNTWVSVGKFGNIYYATDPSSDTNWTATSYGGNLHLTSVSFGDGRFIAVGQGPIYGWEKSPVMVVSDDNGVSWMEKALPSEFTTNNRPLGDIAYGNERWSAMGNGGDFLLSTDGGDSWTVIALDTYGGYDIAYRP